MNEKLKTLKDLNACDDGQYFDNVCVKRTELKTEAIKWVKNCKYDCCKIVRCIACKRTMKMNNITESELKDEK